MALFTFDKYGDKNLKAVWSEEGRLDRLLKVEAALAHAQADAGFIPKEAKSAISKAVASVKLSRVYEIEKEAHHDIMAVTKALAEHAGKHGGYVHFGATSNDINDSATALQVRESIDKFIEPALAGLVKELKHKAAETRTLVCVGRTHGQQAIPTTYGVRFALWATTIERDIERLHDAKKRLYKCKINGAVGTSASLGKKAYEIQKNFSNVLGLGHITVSSQVMPRDIHAEYLSILAIIAKNLEKMATDIRTWSRTEIGEILVSFSGKQVGSSTMAHKKNPVDAEQICGIARVIAAYSGVGLENIPLWEERDLTNSSAERIVLPQATILTHHIIQKMEKITKGLAFDKENIRKNLEMTKGLVLAERVMIELAKKTGDRQEAHELLREIMLGFNPKKETFAQCLMRNKKIRDNFKQNEITALLKPETYLGTALEIAGKA